MPALFTSTSILPKREIVSETTCIQSSSEATPNLWFWILKQPLIVNVGALAGDGKQGYNFHSIKLERK